MKKIFPSLRPVLAMACKGRDYNYYQRETERFINPIARSARIGIADNTERDRMPKKITRQVRIPLAISINDQKIP